MEIKAILENFKKQGLFGFIERFKYMPYEIDYALKIVEAIGKDRNPNFCIDEENRFLYENLIRWVHGDPAFICIDPETKKTIPGRLQAGIYIAGNTGTGKSWALEIMSAYCLLDNVQVNAGGVQCCLRWPCINADTICSKYTINGTIDEYKRKLVLCIQDLGAESIESIYMGNRICALRDILEYRGERPDQITIISSNLPINHDRLISRYGDRVASRLNEMCNYFELRGKDRRKN